ncbi:MAG: ABC transporter permease subunit, partial [Myxococcota bacterium]
VRQILPQFIDSIRLQIGPAMVYLIAAEMVCAGEGFGYRIRIQFKKLDMDVVYPYLVLLAVFGFLMDWLLRKLQERTCPWYVGAQSR